MIERIETDPQVLQMYSHIEDAVEREVVARYDTLNIFAQAHGIVKSPVLRSRHQQQLDKVLQAYLPKGPYWGRWTVTVGYPAEVKAVSTYHGKRIEVSITASRINPTVTTKIDGAYGEALLIVEAFLNELWFELHSLTAKMCLYETKANTNTSPEVAEMKQRADHYLEYLNR